MHNNVENEIKSVLSEKLKGEQYAIDGNLIIAMSLARINGDDVWLWGAIKQIDLIIDVLRTNEIMVEGIIDSDPEKIGSFVCGIQVFSPDEFLNVRRLKTFVMILAGSCKKECSGIEENEFTRILKKAKVENYYIVSEKDKEVLSSSSHTWIDFQRIEYYKNHEKELIDFAKKLEDEESIDTLIFYLRSYITNDVYRGKQIATRYKYFYGDNYEKIYNHLPDENWINCGSSIGDTILSYFSLGLCAKNIWAFEADCNTFNRLKDVINMLPDEKRKSIQCINKTLDEKTIMDFGEERVTLVNADIEGNELALLHAIGERIKKDRPVLAICVYHLKEDLVEIPNYLQRIVGDYKYYLRKHTPYIYNFNRNHELVLYAIPNERAVI